MTVKIERAITAPNGTKLRFLSPLSYFTGTNSRPGKARL
jgi:hypothetical protein